MPDPIFADARLAAIYDPLAPERSDLDPYLAMLEEFDVTSLVDVGCGTGTFAIAAAGSVRRSRLHATTATNRGDPTWDVIGVDPAAASIDVAQAKPGSDAVQWIAGDAVTLADDRASPIADLVVMTGNVAQVFIDDEDWLATLSAARRMLRAGGRFVFETRDRGARAWEGWATSDGRRRVRIDGIGTVETWREVLDVSLPLVSFRHHFVFESDGAVVASDSTLKFRERDELVVQLAACSYVVDEVRDAPDRPGMEFVFIARAV